MRWFTSWLELDFADLFEVYELWIMMMISKNWKGVVFFFFFFFEEIVGKGSLFFHYFTLNCIEYCNLNSNT